MWLHTRKKLNMKAFTQAAFNANWAWTSKITKHISAIWMFQAMLCVLRSIFVGKHVFHIQAVVIYKCLIV